MSLSRFRTGVLHGAEITELFNHALEHHYALPAVNGFGRISVNAVLKRAVISEYAIETAKAVLKRHYHLEPHYGGVHNVAGSSLHSATKPVYNYALATSLGQTSADSLQRKSTQPFSTTSSAAYSMTAKRTTIAAKTSTVPSKFQESSISMAMSLNGIVEVQVEVKVRASGEWVNKETANHLIPYQIVERCLQIMNLQGTPIEKLNAPLQIKTQPWQEGRQAIEEKLSRSEVKEVFGAIHPYVELIRPQSDVLYRKFIILSQRFNHNEQCHVVKGTSQDQAYLQERNSIVDALLVFMDEVGFYFQKE